MKHPLNQRKRQASVYATQAELELWKRAAESIGLPLSEFMRISANIGSRQEHVEWMRSLSLSQLKAL